MHFRVSSVLENWLNEVFCYYFPSCISNIFLCGNTRTWNAQAVSIIFILPSVTQQCRGSAISASSGQKFNFVNENCSYLFKWNPSLHDSLMTVENFFKFPEYSKMIFFLLILIKEFQSLSFKLITTFFLVSISFRPRSKSSFKTLFDLFWASQKINPCSVFNNFFIQKIEKVFLAPTWWRRFCSTRSTSPWSRRQKISSPEKELFSSLKQVQREFDDVDDDDDDVGDDGDALNLGSEHRIVRR